MSEVFLTEDEKLLCNSMKRRLIDLAKNQEPMGYQKFSDEFFLGWDMHDIEDRKKIGKLLGYISENEHAENKPLLSVFIKHEDGLPGAGFFTMAEELGRFIPKFMSKDDFVKRERQYAYNYWNQHKE